MVKVLKKSTVLYICERMLCIWTDPLEPQANYEHRFFEFPDLDDDFMVTKTTKLFISHYRF
jgi:hypothetical protein